MVPYRLIFPEALSALEAPSFPVALRDQDSPSRLFPLGFPEGRAHPAAPEALGAQVRPEVLESVAPQSVQVYSRAYTHNNSWNRPPYEKNSCCFFTLEAHICAAPAQGASECHKLWGLACAIQHTGIEPRKASTSYAFDLHLDYSIWIEEGRGTLKNGCPQLMGSPFMPL